MTASFESTGSIVAVDMPLSAPQHPEATVVVEHPEEQGVGHEVQIFSSTHKRLGGYVTAFAQQLQTEVYLEKDYIEEGDVNELGVYTDEYSDRATHFFVKNGKKIAAARAIHGSKSEGLLSFPTTKHFEVDPDKLREAASIDRLTDIKSSEVVEISGLAAKKIPDDEGSQTSFDATIALYARMTRMSLEQGHKLWVLNVEKSFLPYLYGMAGREQVHVLGPEKSYMGPDTLPVAINPQEMVRSALEDDTSVGQMKQAYLKEVLAGISDKKIPADIRELMEERQIVAKKCSAFMRLITNPKVLASAAILGYSAARPLPAAGVDEFHGDLAWLWGIDVVTAIPYTLCAIETFAGKSLPRRAAAAVGAAAFFTAPYAYFVANGENYPGYVNAVVAGFAGVTVISETVRQITRSKKEKKIQAGLRLSGAEVTVRTGLEEAAPAIHPLPKAGQA